MRSHATQEFWKLFHQLPDAVQRQARKAYALFRQNPFHPSLRYKLIKDRVYSVRISREYRALGRLEEEDVIVWFWIGNHESYDRMLKHL